MPDGQYSSITPPKKPAAPKKPAVKKVAAPVKAAPKYVAPAVVKKAPPPLLVGDQGYIQQQTQAAAARQNAALRARVAAVAAQAAALALQRKMAADRAAQVKAFIDQRRGTEQSRQGAAEQNRLAAEAKRQKEAGLAYARTQAYNALQARSAAVLRSTPWGVDTVARANRASTLRQTESYREKYIRSGKQGDWTDALKMLQRQTRDSAGTGIDAKLLEAVQAGYVQPMRELRDEFSDLVADLSEAEASGDEAALLKLVEDPKNRELYEKFLEAFGDGIKPGTFTKHQQMLEKISSDRQRAWSVRMGLGGAPESEVQSLIRQAQREGKSLVYQDEVLDPETGKMKKVRLTGTDAWLARYQAQEFDRVQSMYMDQQRWNRMIEPGEGLFNQVKSWMPEWQLDAQGVPTRIAAAAGNPGLQEQLIREFLKDAGEAYDRNHGPTRERLDQVGQDKYQQIVDAMGDAPTGSRGGASPQLAGQISGQLYRQAKNTWLTALARRFGKSQWGDLEQFSTTGLGGVAQGALTVASTVPALVRNRLQQDFGSFQPHVDVRLPFLSESPGATVGKSLDPTAGAANRALEATWDGTGSFWDQLGAWGSVVRDNAMWGSGNLGGLLTQATDPTLLMGPGRFTQAGSLAIARAGGIRALREGGIVGLRGAAVDFGRYLGPKALGGAGRDVVKIELAKVSLARRLGLNGSEVLRMSDDEFRQMAQRAAANQTDELLSADTIKRLTQASGMDKPQLLNMVQQELPGILRQYKIFAEDPFEAASRMRTVRMAAERARSQAESAVQLQRMQVERAAAMQTLAELTGRPLQAPKLSTKQMARHEALVSDYAGATQDYLKIAEAGVKAADEIELGRANPRDLRGLQAQLKRSAEQVKRFEDEYGVERNGSKTKYPTRYGEVSQRFQRLAEFRGEGDPTAPSFVDQSWDQVRYDERRLKALIRGTLRDLKGTPLDQTLSGQLKARLKRLEQARRGLVYERALLDDGRTLMRPYVRKHMNRVEKAITPQRVAPLAADEAQLSHEIGRDVMRQLNQATAKPMMKLSAAEEEALPQLRKVLSTKVDTVAALGADRAVMARRALGRDLTVQDLWTVLRMADRDPLWAEELGGALRQTQVQVMKTAKDLGFRFGGNQGRDASDWLWDLLREDHQRLGAQAQGITDFSKLDSTVEGALVSWRKRVAEGQIRLRERRFKPPAGAPDALFHDTDPFENLVKQRVLEREGVSLFAYDELRGVLRRPMLRQNAARGIRRRAAARGGEDALRLERAETARREIARNVEEFATRPELQGLPPETRLRAFEEKVMLDDLPRNVGVQVSEYQQNSLRKAFTEQTGLDIDDTAAVAERFQAEFADVLGNRSAMLRRMEQDGHFSPRTGEAIREGQRAWSVDEEREFFKGFMAYEPPWTDAAMLRAALNDPRLHEVMLREWGFFDDEFENLAATSGLKPSEMADAVVWGKDGFQRQRTIAELRQWAIERYGTIVSPDGETLTRMPWLMKPDDEYLNWTKGLFDDPITGSQHSALLAIKDRLPEEVQKAFFDGDALSRAGMEIDPRLVKARELHKLRDAITRATKRRIDRLTKAGDVEAGEWLAQEQLRFAYDVTDQLMVDPVWRGLLRGAPVTGTLLRTWGQFWRLLVSWQPAFPIMNLIDAYGFKRLYLTVFEGGFRPLSIEADGRRLLPGSSADVLRKIGAESDSIFGLSGGSPWARVGDKYLDINQRGGALVSGVTRIPVSISKFGEDHLRADFARRIAGDTFRTARREGMSVENAEHLAMAEAKRMVDSFFAMSGGQGWLTALNELVPFFSYNFKNKTLALQILWSHPSVYAWGERIRSEVEAANREQWAKDHPDLPFPEGASGSWLWWKVGDDYYKIDLSSFSDWTRAMGNVLQPHTPTEWLSEFLRVPHPSQMGALAMFTGGDTPWGNPGHIRELSFWADLFYWTQGEDLADPRKRRDLIQIMSQMLFFKKFGKIGAMDIKQATFFALQQVNEEKARAYLEANPDLQLYWDALPPKDGVRGLRKGFKDLLTTTERKEYDAAFKAYNELNDTLDAKVAEFATDPSSDEYKQAKREAFIARQVFLSENPILTKTWGSLMTPAEFAEFNERARVDDLADAWFNWQRPARDDFKTELAYQQALVDFNERREFFLEANPALKERLMAGRTAAEVAWHQQELHWTEILDFQARLKVKILEQEALGDASDPEFVDLLYRVRDLAGADLDADRFGVFDLKDRGPGRAFATLPGFADWRYARATPEEKKQMKQDEWYFDTLKSISSKATDGRSWYALAQANPAFMQEYWRRNPQKKAEYDANQEYIRWIGSWARALQANNFDGAQQVWDQMPAWAKERYFLKHPDSGMRDGMGGSGGSTAVQYNGQWFKSPESRDRYIAFVEGGGKPGAFVEQDGQFFKSADSRDRFLAGQAYFASISRWVGLLKSGNFAAADKHFRSMPAWMKEKYYERHPDQRAKNDLDMDALRRGAEYFLASGDDKLKVLADNPQLRAWLKEHGGDEEAFRGLINAMYRAIPSSEPWLKRTFREKFPEIFSQEALGDRRLRSVATELATHPEMLPFYEKALKLQSQLFQEQLKHSKVQPKPWSMERKSRAKKRTKRRAARLHSKYTLHRDILRYGGS